MFEREVNQNDVTQADIVVGLASYNEADSIDYPTQQTSLGLRKYHGDASSVILNCDNHSPDDTEGFDYDLFVKATFTSGDVNGDGKVDIFDLSFIAAHYGGSDPAADVNEDGQVDIFDLTVAAGNYGQTLVVIE